MTYNTQSIAKLIAVLRKELHVENRLILSDVGILHYSLRIQDEQEKVIILQLTDYISYLLNLIESSEIFKNEDKINLLNHSLSLLETMVRSMQKKMEDTAKITQQNLEILKQTKEKNRLMKNAIASALLEWTRSDAAFTDNVASIMAEKLKEGI